MNIAFAFPRVYGSEVSLLLVYNTTFLRHMLILHEI